MVPIERLALSKLRGSFAERRRFLRLLRQWQAEPRARSSMRFPSSWGGREHMLFAVSSLVIEGGAGFPWVVALSMLCYLIVLVAMFL